MYIGLAKDFWYFSDEFISQDASRDNFQYFKPEN